MEDQEIKVLLGRRVDDCGPKRRPETGVIAKLVGARCEVEDVLLSSSRSAVLSEQERIRLSILMGTIDSIVRRIEQVVCPSQEPVNPG